MEVSIRNIEKYFDDHPEIIYIELGISRLLEILKKAIRESRSGIISAGSIKDILGPELSLKFFEEVTRNVEHVRIGIEDLHKTRKGF